MNISKVNSTPAFKAASIEINGFKHTKDKKDVLSAYDEKITALQNKKACAEQVYDLMKTKEFKSTLNRLPNGDVLEITTLPYIEHSDEAFDNQLALTYSYDSKTSDAYAQEHRNGDTYNTFAIDTSKGKIDKDGILTWLDSIAKSLGK